MEQQHIPPFFFAFVSCGISAEVSFKFDMAIWSLEAVAEEVDFVVDDAVVFVLPLVLESFSVFFAGAVAAVEVEGVAAAAVAVAVVGVDAVVEATVDLVFVADFAGAAVDDDVVAPLLDLGPAFFDVEIEVVTVEDAVVDDTGAGVGDDTVAAGLLLAVRPAVFAVLAVDAVGPAFFFLGAVDVAVDEAVAGAVVADELLLSARGWSPFATTKRVSLGVAEALVLRFGFGGGSTSLPNSRGTLSPSIPTA
eukprot:m.72697 g.72697  ORF g.72697 m.72697 type:complete len:250 (-) comp14423_c0_seq2:387-1136(-)